MDGHTPDGHLSDLDALDGLLDPASIAKLANELYSEMNGDAPPTAHLPSLDSAVEHFEPVGLDTEVRLPALAPRGGDGVSLAQRFGLQRYYFLPETPPEPVSSTTVGAFDAYRIRQDFPALRQMVHGKPLIWLDNAATSQKPQCVIDTLKYYYEHDNSNVHRAAHELAARSTEAYEASRRKIQRFLGARSDREIVFVRGTTEGINLVAQTYGRRFIGRGDEIVLTTVEHHSNIVPWQMLAQEKGAIIRVAPITDRGEIILEEYERLLTPRTRLVAMSHVSNVLGTVLPVQAMTSMAHRVGARVLVDGAQAVPHFRVNVQQLDSDFYVFSGHKVFGPTGIGALYGKEQLLETMPPWQGGGSMIKSVSFEETTYNEIPAKFEAGTPNIADAVALGSAIDYLDRIGFETAARYEEELTSYGMQALQMIPGLRPIGTAPGKLSVLSFVLDGIPPEEVGSFLDRKGIAVRSGHHCAQPTMTRYGVSSTVRPALAMYNTREDIDALALAIRQAQRELSRM